MKGGKKPETGKKYLLNIYLIKDLHLEQFFKLNNKKANNTNKNTGLNRHFTKDTVMAKRHMTRFQHR